MKLKFKPNFLIVGVARCGTTSLYHYISQHPNIQFCKIKEPKFFSSINQIYPHNGPGDDTVDREVVKNHVLYSNLFSGIGKEMCVGEASSDYFYFHKNTVPLIKNTLGDVKIIICLRNPLDRSFSAYNNLIRDSRETLTFLDAIKSEKERINDNYDWMWHYVNASLYSDGVKNFLQNFSKVKIIFNEDLLSKPSIVCKDIFRFLEVDETFKPDVSNRFSVSGKPKNLLIKIISSRVGLFKHLRSLIVKILPRILTEKLSSSFFKKVNFNPDAKDLLKSKFTNDIIELEKITGRNLNKWKI